MATLQDYRNERLRKLETLRQLGVEPYPAKSERTHTCAEVLSKYDELAGKEVVVAGRVASIRSFGKLAFIKLRDQSGDVQLYLQRDDVAELDAARGVLGMKQLKLLDTGDFIEAKGVMTTTQTGEKSVGVRELRLLTKSLRPMPEKLENKEERLRRRYVDMNVNPEVRERFIRRSKFWQATRDYLNSHGFIEINVPVLEHTTGGADANPFVTHMDALGDQQFYLRISHELPLKRLIGAGFEKVYDLGPRFRNENYSDEHLPEHIAMEWYAAYWDWKQGMRFMESMYKDVLQKTFGTLQFQLGKFNVDMSGEWEVWDYAEVIRKHYGIDVYNTTIEEVAAKLKEHNLEVEKTDSIPRSIDKLWKNIRKDVAGPGGLVNTPKFISPLSKTNPENPETVERFQPVIAGSELGNGFSELNDPIDQRERFENQLKLRDLGDDEANEMDTDYVEALEYGLPPTGGVGLGIDRLVMLLTNSQTIREVLLFPHMRLNK